MGISLAAREPVFREALEELDALIRQRAGWSLLTELAAPPERSRLDHTEYAQPAIFAIEVALARLLRSWGVIPAAVTGHSAGEVAAAHLAEVLDLKEAVRMVVCRGRLLEAAAGQGGMATVRLPASAVAAEIAPLSDAVSIAAINGPRATVISGRVPAVQVLADGWRKRGIGCRPLPVNYAFHSTLMQPLSETLVRELGTVRTAPPTIPILSTVFGRTAAGREFDAAYWGWNVRRPVLFEAALRDAFRMGLEHVVEIGPHPVLIAAIAECLSAAGIGGGVYGSLRRHQDERASLAMSLQALYAAGYPVFREALYPKPAGTDWMPPASRRIVRASGRKLSGGRVAG